MVTKKYKHIIAAICLLLAIALLPVNSLADGVKAKYSKLIIYSKASTDSKELGSVKKGAVLDMKSAKGDWVEVKYDGKTGYVLKSQVTHIEEEETKSTEKTAYVQSKVKLYASASTKAKSNATLEAGEKVLVSGAKNGWAKVRANGKNGYVQEKYLGGKPPAKDSTPTVKGTTMYASVEQLNIHSSPSSKSKILKKLSLGDKITVYDEGGDWFKADSGSTKGYVYAKHLSKTKPDSKPAEESSGDLKEGSRGSSVKNLQERLQELKYLSDKADGVYGSATKSAVAEFQTAMKIKATGVADSETIKALKSSSAKSNPNAGGKSGEAKPTPTPAPTKATEATKSPASTKSPATISNGSVISADWWTSGIQKTFSRGTIVTVTDVSTGISWKEKRTGGTNHADCQPVTAEDTAKMKKAMGGSWSWDRRAIWVTIGGQKYAASMNGMPHGSDSIPDNDFNGHHCIHFLNSRTHTGNRLDAAHQSAVKKALNAG